MQSAFATEAAFFVAAEWTGWIEILLPLSVRFVRSYDLFARRKNALIDDHVDLVFSVSTMY